MDNLVQKSRISPIKTPHGYNEDIGIGHERQFSPLDQLNHDDRGRIESLYKEDTHRQIHALGQLIVNSHRGQKVLSVSRNYQHPLVNFTETICTGGKISEDIFSWISEQNFEINAQNWYEALQLLFIAKQQNIQVTPEDDLYEVIALPCINNEIRPQKKYDKWNQILADIQKNPEILRGIFKSLGFIPKQIYNRLGYYEHTHIKNGVAMYDVLSNLQVSPGSIQEKQKRWTRSQYLQYFLSPFEKFDKKSGIKTLVDAPGARMFHQERKHISLDTNGVKIELFMDGKRLNSHIPFGEIIPSTLQYWKEKGWISSAEYTESKKQMYKEDGLIRHSEDIENQQWKEIVSMYTSLFGESPSSEVGEIPLDWCIRKIVEYPERFAQILLENGAIIPDKLLHVALSGVPGLSSQEIIYALVRLSECVAISLAQEVIIGEGKLFGTYDMAHNSRDIYQIRSKFIGNPIQYSSYRIIQKLVERLTNIEYDSQSGYVLFAGAYRSTKFQQTFLEVCYGDKTPTRVLVYDDKHFPRSLGKKFAQIPKLDNNQFVILEIFMRSTALLRKQYHASIKGEIGIDQFRSFLWMYIQDYFPELTQEFRISEDNIMLLQSFATKLINSYIGTFLQKIVKYELSWSNIRPTVRKLKLDNTYLAGIQALLPAYRFDTGISSSGEEILIADIKPVSKREKRGVGPEAIMAAANSLEALEIDNNRPLIVFSGGAREIGDDAKNKLTELTQVIISSAAKAKANLSIPCTQSGIAVLLSREYLRHKALMTGLPENEKIDMWSIATGNNIFTGEKIPGPDQYGISPVKTISINGIDAEWGVTGKNIKNVGYFDFINWLETIFERADSKKSRVHIIGNGGLFTIAEILAAMRNNPKIIFLSDSGRFGALGAFCIEHFSELYPLISKFENAHTTDEYGAVFAAFESYMKQYLSAEDYMEIQMKDWGNGFPSGNDRFSDFDNFFDQDVIGDLKHKQLLYRKYVFDFLKQILLSEKKPLFTTIDNLKTFL